MSRTLGLDVGERTVGVAVSDELGLTAQGLSTVVRRGDLDRDLEQIAALASEYQVEAVVVGLPRNMDGSLGPRARQALAFADAIRERLGLPVHTWDERWTTRAAERLLVEGGASRRRRRRSVDKVAAALILQGYLDRRRRGA